MISALGTGRGDPLNGAMRIIPVLDVKGGFVVRAVAGRRAEYHPVLSRLTASARPLDVARAFRFHFGLSDLYLADLDALAGGQPALALCTELHRDGFRLWVDAGLRDAGSAAPLVSAGVGGLVFGLETLAGPAALAEACRLFGSRVIFSLDLKAGEPLGDPAVWDGADAPAIARRAIACGAQTLIMLDLARVGVGGGTGTEELCRRVTAACPQVEVFVGGGVRGVEDLRRLKECGVAGALVASALHDGSLRREGLRS